MGCPKLTYHLTAEPCLRCVYNAAAVAIRTGSEAWKIYYIHRDYLGSICAITNTPNGNDPVVAIEKRSYDAWGRLRKPTTLQPYGPGEQPALFLNRGYTGHEHLPEFGLINCNARLYDPVIGRFLSPDPYVQAPDLSQSYNRYSYCWNNPLIYTDPDGEFIFSFFIPGAGIFIDAALWSGTINLISNRKNINNFGEGVAVFLAGAGSGVLTVVNPVLGATVGSAVVSATNEAVGQMEKWSDFGNMDWGRVGIEAGIGVATGLVTYGTGEYLKKTNLPNNILDKMGVEKPWARNILGQGITGTIGGTAAGLTNGLAKGAIYGEWDMMFDRTWQGGALGGAGGLIYGGINQLGFEIYKRTGERRHFDAARNTGGNVKRGIEKIGKEGFSGSNGGFDDVGGNGIVVVARKNGLVTATAYVPNPIHGAVPTVQSWSYYYQPSFYRHLQLILQIRR